MLLDNSGLTAVVLTIISFESSSTLIKRSAKWIINNQRKFIFTADGKGESQSAYRCYSFPVEGLPAKKIFGVLKLFTLVIIMVGLLGISLFAGLMIATAGIAIYPPLTNITAPLACSGEFTIESKTYSK